MLIKLENKICKLTIIIDKFILIFMSILITGAGGTVGIELIRSFAKKKTPPKIIAIDRCEHALMRLLALQKNIEYDFEIKYVDLCKSESGILENLNNVETVIHCAAMKSVQIGYLFPEELATQNILAFANLKQVAIKSGVKKVLLCSTDKAASPTSVMGSSKLLLERICSVSSNEVTKFASIRFGNILNSSGSVIPTMLNSVKEKGKIYITDKDMTRYILTKDDFLELVFFALENMKGGEVFIPVCKSMNILDLSSVVKEIASKIFGISENDIEIVFGNNKYNESIHEKMASDYEYDNVYRINDRFFKIDQNAAQNEISNFKCSKQDLLYLSSSGNEILEKNELKEILLKNMNLL